MLKVGITGGIGSGKSTVCEIFRHLGTPVFNSDFEAKKLLDTADIKNFYKKEFGKVVFTNGYLDKQKIASLIFNNSSAIQKVDEYVHPIVNRIFVDWTKNQNNCLYVIKEAALLIESGSYKELDFTVLIIAPQDLRMKRVILRDGSSEDIVLQRIKNQMPDDKKMLFANYIISNDKQSLLLPQVLKIHQIFIAKAQLYS